MHLTGGFASSMPHRTQNLIKTSASLPVVAAVCKAGDRLSRVARPEHPPLPDRSSHWPKIPLLSSHWLLHFSSAPIPGIERQQRGTPL